MKKLFIIRYLSCFAFGLCLLIGSSSFVGQKNVSSECVNTIWFDLEGNIGPYKVFMHVDYDAEVGEKCGYYFTDNAVVFMTIQITSSHLLWLRENLHWLDAR